MKIFDSIELAPPDPILGLTEAFKNDSNPDKINLSVGVYQDDTGKSPVLESVRKAELMIWESAQAKTYLPIPGDAAYLKQVQKIVFGENSNLLSENKVSSAHTPGGTGALRVAGDFIKANFKNSSVWLSNPTWANHNGIFEAAGLESKSYNYFDKLNNSLDWEGMKASLNKIPSGDAVVLHGCCHNPTGVDPTQVQWKEIAEICKKRSILGIIDFAYQGFANGIEKDLAAVNAFASSNNEFMVCSSFSKNFGLYQDRVGTLHIVSNTSDVNKKVLSQLKRIIRTNYSNPPAHGGAIVSTILQSDELTAIWKDELAKMRSRIKDMRSLFVSKLSEHGVKGDYSFINNQNGMFSFSGLTPESVEKLKTDYSIYIVKSGRINVAGISSSNVDKICTAISEVV